MAINLITLYVGKVNGSDPGNYTYGSARNITVPADSTGTPWEQAIVNDTQGFHQALLARASIVPTGTAENETASQYVQCLDFLYSRQLDSVASIFTQNMTGIDTIAINSETFDGDGGGTIWRNTGVVTAPNAGTYDPVTGIIYDSEGTAFKRAEFFTPIVHDTNIEGVLRFAAENRRTAFGAGIVSPTPITTFTAITTQSNLIGGNFESSAATSLFRVTTSVTNTNFTLVDMRGSNGNAYEITSSNAKRARVLACRVEAQNTAIEMATAANLDEAQFALNFILAEDEDGIAVNSVANSTDNIQAIGNSIQAGLLGGGTKGRAVNIEGTKNYIISMNMVRACELDAVRVRYGQRGGVITSNTGKNINENGIVIVQRENGFDPDTEGTVLMGNNLKHGGTKTGFYAYKIEPDLIDPLEGVAVIGNVGVGFDSGYQQDDNTDDAFSGANIVIGNVFFDCNTGIDIGDNNSLYGDNLIIDTPTMASLGNMSRCGRVMHNKTPTTILDNSQMVAFTVGGYMEGFNFIRSNYAHGGAGAQNFTLFATPTRMSGRLTVICNSVGQDEYFMYSAYVTVGAAGTLSFEADTDITDIGGNVTNIVFADSGTNIVVTVTSTSVIAATTINIDFNGVFYERQ